MPGARHPYLNREASNEDVKELEAPISAVDDFTQLLIDVRCSDNVPREQVQSVFHVAIEPQKHIEALSEFRGKLFHGLHPGKLVDGRFVS